MSGRPVVHVVDDDDAVRDSLEVLLDSEGLAVRTYGSPLQFLGGADDLAEGCVLMDVRMPEMDGLELLERLRAKGVRLPVIVMTGHGDVPVAVQAMKGGAFDFIEKPFEDEHLLSRVRAALDQAHKQRHQAEEAAEAGRRIAQLTDREREVFDELVLGHANKEIALNLGISPRTVEIHRARVLEKLHARNLSDLLRTALAAGLAIEPRSRPPSQS